MDFNVQPEMLYSEKVLWKPMKIEVTNGQKTYVVLNAKKCAADRYFLFIFYCQNKGVKVESSLLIIAIKMA